MVRDRFLVRLMRLPEPLLVWRLDAPAASDTIAKIRSHISAMAFERLEPHLRHRIGVLPCYYPAPPVRAHAVGRAAHMPSND